MSKDGYVLVVDDEKDIREAIAELLSYYGHDVKVAGNGREALEVARESVAPRLILLDLMMPLMDGLEFNRLKWADPALHGVPVCVMTASGLQVPLSKGIVFVIRKPIDTRALIEVVERIG